MMSPEAALIRSIDQRNEQEIVSALGSHIGHDVSIEEEPAVEGDVWVILHCWTCDTEVLSGGHP